MLQFKSDAARNLLYALHNYIGHLFHSPRYHVYTTTTLQNDDTLHYILNGIMQSIDGMSIYFWLSTRLHPRSQYTMYRWDESQCYAMHSMQYPVRMCSRNGKLKLWKTNKWIIQTLNRNDKPRGKLLLKIIFNPLQISSISVSVISVHVVICIKIDEFTLIDINWNGLKSTKKFWTFWIPFSSVRSTYLYINNIY